MSLYCGNNRLYPDLINGTKVQGTRYQCFKKGVGIGMNLPYDPAYAKYRPIDRTKLYCGKERKLPAGYTRKGTPSLCLRKGVGVGKSIRAKQHKKARKRKNNR